MARAESELRASEFVSHNRVSLAKWLRLARESMDEPADAIRQRERFCH